MGNHSIQLMKIKPITNNSFHKYKRKFKPLTYNYIKP